MNKLHRKYFSDYFLNFNMPKNGTEKDGEAPRIPSIIYKMFNVIFRSLFTSTEEGLLVGCGAERFNALRCL